MKIIAIQSANLCLIFKITSGFHCFFEPTFVVVDSITAARKTEKNQAANTFISSKILLVVLVFDNMNSSYT